MGEASTGAAATTKRLRTSRNGDEHSDDQETESDAAHDAFSAKKGIDAKLNFTSHANVLQICS